MVAELTKKSKEVKKKSKKTKKQKNGKAKKGHGWRKLERIKISGLYLGKFEKPRPTFFSNFYQCISKCHLHNWKIILSCYVAVILQMKDCCSAIFTFRAHH